jgi:uncharacterized protein
MTSPIRRKPDDIGDGYCCASLLPTGDWLALLRPHRTHGIVELTGAPEFDEAWRNHPDAVRRYRAALAAPASAFLAIEGDVSTELTRQGVDADGTLWQELHVDLADGNPVFRFAGRLQRPPYAEITDTAPLPPLPTTTHVQANGDMLVVDSPNLRSTATIRVITDPPAAWSVDSPMTATCALAAPEDRGQLDVLVQCRLHTDHDPPRPCLADASPVRTWADDDPRVTRVIDGTRRYVMGCCALWVGGDQVALVTDHRLLPLSWTRDAYYMALLLLLTPGGDDRAAEIIESHLRWLWGPAHRTGTWARSHLTNGAVKDPGTQADQQLYPMLELVDFRARCQRWPDCREADVARWWGNAVTGALAALPRHVGTGLLPSQENPADDPAELPYPFSTQVLYAHVLDQLAQWQDELGIDDGVDLRAQAESVRAAALSAFTVDGPNGPQFAYEVDLEGRHRLYADANDLPTAFAPAWRFCPATSPEWQNTMSFAFGPANRGWSPGVHGGLGSVHTPGTWPLGDIQALAWRRQLGDHASYRQVLDGLLQSASHDGLLPEAYDSSTGEWTARHWFGWPSAALGCLLVSPTIGVEPRP